MPHVHRLARLLLIVASLTCGGGGTAWARGAKARGDEEPPKGTGMLVGGIVLLSVGATYGGIQLFSSAFYFCEDDDESCKSERDRAKQEGYLITGASIVGGVLMIGSANADRRVWKDWMYQNDPEYKKRHPRADATPLRLDLGLVDRKPGAILTYAF